MRPLISIKELSCYLGIKEKTLYAMVGAKTIPCVRFRRLIRFDLDEIDLWVKEKKVAPISPEQEAKKILKTVLREPNINIDAILKNAIEKTNHKPI